MSTREVFTYYGEVTSTDGTQATPFGYALAEGIYAVHDALQRTAVEMMRAENLTEALVDAIFQLDPAAGPRSRGALAELLHCDPSNVTLLVDRLSERGLVESRPDSRDRRMKMIALTPAGEAVRERLVSWTANHPVFANLTEDEQRHLAALLARCLDSVGEAQVSVGNTA
jgi:MarR family transcriptional regulator, organic hydroperoxide resistance regulator